MSMEENLNQTSSSKWKMYVYIKHVVMSIEENFDQVMSTVSGRYICILYCNVIRGHLRPGHVYCDWTIYVYIKHMCCYQTCKYHLL